MIKTQVYLTERQTAAIKSMSDSRGISKAEQIRRLLDDAIDRHIRAPDPARGPSRAGQN